MSHNICEYLILSYRAEHVLYWMKENHDNKCIIKIAATETCLFLLMDRMP